MPRQVKNREIYCQLANLIDNNPKDVQPGRQWNDKWVQILVELAEERLIEVAMMCTKQYETVEQIAQRAGVAPENIENELFESAMQGTGSSRLLR